MHTVFMSISTMLSTVDSIQIDTGMWNKYIEWIDTDSKCGYILSTLKSVQNVQMFLLPEHSFIVYGLFKNYIVV